MYGGGYFYNIRKGSEKSCNIIAYLTDTSDTFKLFQRNKRLLLNGGDNGKQLHITLLNILFNKNAPCAIKDVLLDAQDNIKPHMCPLPFENGFRMFADLDKCVRIYHSKSKGFDQKRTHTFENG